MKKIFAPYFLAVCLLTSGCDITPEPVNEEEVITTFSIILSPNGAGSNVILKFYDADGNGSTAPVITVSGALVANKSYTANAEFINETVHPYVDITSEIKAEAEDHLLCFEVSGAAITITPVDKDANNLAIGLVSTWDSGGASAGSVKVTLRHQPEMKTGECPGGGDTDLEVEFNVSVIGS